MVFGFPGGQSAVFLAFAWSKKESGRARGGGRGQPTLKTNPADALGYKKYFSVVVVDWN